MLIELVDPFLKMWRQNHTNTMLRFPHETLEPILLNHVVEESKMTQVKKKATKKGAKEVAEERSKKKVYGDGEGESDGGSSSNRSNQSTVAKKEQERNDTSVPVVGDEPVIVKSTPQDTKEQVKEINNTTEVVVEPVEGRGKNEEEEQTKTVTPKKAKKKCIVQ